MSKYNFCILCVLTVIETSLKIVLADTYIPTIRPTVFLYSCSKQQSRKHRIKVAEL